jgi:TRAP transporter TAXI family solute receptor
VAAVVNGHADAVWQTYVPHAADLQELESAREIVYLQIEDEIVKKLVDGAGYMEFQAPADWFKDKQSVNTFMEDTVVFTHKDAPDDVIYETTKIILENKEKWFNGQKAFESFEPEHGWEGTIIPLHQGAEKAYKELGYMP